MQLHLLMNVADVCSNKHAQQQWTLALDYDSHNIRNCLRRWKLFEQIADLWSIAKLATPWLAQTHLWPKLKRSMFLKQKITKREQPITVVWFWCIFVRVWQLISIIVSDGTAKLDSKPASDPEKLIWQSSGTYLITSITWSWRWKLGRRRTLLKINTEASNLCILTAETVVVFRWTHSPL